MAALLVPLAGFALTFGMLPEHDGWGALFVMLFGGWLSCLAGALCAMVALLRRERWRIAGWLLLCANAVPVLGILGL
ncbi:hypothetical protein [Eleftheria terrae]|uniref:hypothetical protein n=1 Tax=Eleftheria terrae TaxID=1597781 RepID=UPI00263AE125|nr:hypothetical protein [Eleftheria terrae]WKB53564.1 hypothetical protein N7L95_03960 [Eleftheria terrae]